MSTLALRRNPSKAIVRSNLILIFVTLIWRSILRRMRIGRDRRTLQAVPTYLLSDLGLERTEIHTTSGSHEVWIRPRR